MAVEAVTKSRREQLSQSRYSSAWLGTVGVNPIWEDDVKARDFDCIQLYTTAQMEKAEQCDTEDRPEPCAEHTQDGMKLMADGNVGGDT